MKKTSDRWALLIGLAVIIVIVIRFWGPLQESIAQCQQNTSACGCDTNLTAYANCNPEQWNPFWMNWWFLGILLGTGATMALIAFLIGWKYGTEKL